MKRNNNSVKADAVEYENLMFNPAVAENKDFTEIYKFILEYYRDRGPCPALIFMDYGVKEPIYIKNRDGAEAIIVNRNSERLYKDIKRTVRKQAVLYYYDDDFKNVWVPGVDYQMVYGLLLMISDRLKIPAIPIYIAKQMPVENKKLCGMALQNDDQKTTAIILDGTREEIVMFKFMAHELRHVCQHMYHQDWFKDYTIDLPLKDYFNQSAECDAEAYAYLFIFHVCGIRLEMPVGKEKILQRVRELEKEDLFW